MKIGKHGILTPRCWRGPIGESAVLSLIIKIRGEARRSKKVEGAQPGGIARETPFSWLARHTCKMSRLLWRPLMVGGL
jgi:hypothetical protein